MAGILQRVGSACLAVAMIVGALPVNAASGVAGSPRIINLFLNWQLKEEDLPRLARWDVVVLDADQQARYPDRVRRLRQLNPSIKILAYLPSEEISIARFSEPPEYPFAKLASRIQDAWYVRDPYGNKTSFWPGSPLLNVTDRGPAPGGERWNEFFPRFVRDEVLSTGLWDGVFLDNTFDTISYFAKSPVDLDRDGLADAASVADAAWRDGMRKMLRLMRERNPDAIIVGNGGAAYADQLNGAFFEHFPSWSWGPNWKEFRDAIAKNAKPSYTALNVNTDNAERPNDYRLMRFGLGSAMVGGGYYSFDKGDYNHDVLWWYDEYEIPLGSSRADPRVLGGAAGPGIAPAVWARSFENGLVVVNSTNATQKVSLPGIFEKIRGSQDRGMNDGSVISTLEIPAQDGVVLLRRSEATEIRGSAFVNGSFVRMYDASGRQIQNGFFAQRDDVSGGAAVLAFDFNNDGSDELVTSERGAVRVRQGGTSRVASFAPFGSRFTGRLALAAGNTNRDADKEIVLARESGGPPEIRVYTTAGKLLARWDAYAAAFSGGVRVAIGDLDGDGLREIVSGAGGGGGPHVRIWKTDGKVWGGGFFAFDPTERGGVSIAVGDVDGDGRDEIVAGSGQGAVPRVRIFDGRGTLEAEITLGSRPLPGGIQVSSGDMNGDGRAEILITGLPVI